MQTKNVGCCHKNYLRRAANLPRHRGATHECSAVLILPARRETMEMSEANETLYSLRSLLNFRFVCSTFYFPVRWRCPREKSLGLMFAPDRQAILRKLQLSPGQ